MVGTRRHPAPSEDAAAVRTPNKSGDTTTAAAASGKSKRASKKASTPVQDQPAGEQQQLNSIEAPAVKSSRVPDTSTEILQKPQPLPAKGKQKRQHNDQAAAAEAAPAATSDLLPAEVLQQLQQLRQQQQRDKLQRPGQPGSSKSNKQQQPVKKKQRLVEVQKGPVRVAVLPALVAAGAGRSGQQQSVGAALRQQLLESRLHRSRAML